jgi:hypothetical protein
VHGDLTMQAVGQEAPVGVVNRDRRLIARTFNADYTHKPL